MTLCGAHHPGDEFFVFPGLRICERGEVMLGDGRPYRISAVGTQGFIFLFWIVGRAVIRHIHTTVGFSGAHNYPIPMRRR
jgi:hypothetical protein